MENNERIRKLVGAVVEFIYETIDAIDAGKPDLAGQVERLEKQVKKLQDGDPLRKAKTAQIQAQLDKEKDDARTAPAAAGRLERTTSPLPKHVERKGKKFGCNVQRKDVKFRKGGFATAQEAHDYAVGEIEKRGGAVGDVNKGAGGRKGGSRDLPRFVYERDGTFHVLCNRKDVKFNKAGFLTAAEASEWAEAEFVRRSADIATTPPATEAPHANRGKPRTRAEMKAAIPESRERTGNVARRQWECVACGHKFDGVGDSKPERCPECRCVIIAKMEGFAGADAVEVRG